MCVRNKIGSGRKASTQSKENKRQIASTSAGVSFIEDDKKNRDKENRKTERSSESKREKNTAKKKNYRC